VLSVFREKKIKEKKPKATTTTTTTTTNKQMFLAKTLLHKSRTHFRTSKAVELVEDAILEFYTR